MRFLLSALVALATFGIVDAKAPYTDSQYEYAFTKWIKHHNKVYAHDEFFSRFHIFKSNLDQIHHHNNNGNYSYTLSMNQFGDMTQDEFKHTYNGFHGLKHQPLNHHKPHHLKHVQAAESVDWRAKAAVTPVKNQGQCGACWSFSTTGAIEGAAAIATGTLISLSEQQLLDCDDCWRNNTPYCNSACNGGLMDKAFQWIIANGGITGELDQPYIATTHLNCTLSTPIRARITGYSDIPIGDEVTLLKAVNIGPVSIGIEADQTVFQFYSGGVLDDVSCGTSLDHGVLIVGYGTDTTLGKDYWIVKNSWGPAWGEQGYVRLVRNKNQCGLANAASYPTGVH